ncbi:MAG: biopolymer transporter ExbD [Chitinophagaceae bacterium]|nr:MAG: biopolymer transporter ExbD [Chitinophagaceae bacterium]
MASIDNNVPGTKRTVRTNPRIDMTPMVDLGFLLITFFIFTTSLSQEATMRLVMPKAGPELPMKESSSLTVLLTDNAAYAYHGRFETALAAHRVQRTVLATYTGLGDVIRRLQARLAATKGRAADELTLLIKPSASASYQQMIDAIDQAIIHRVKRYAIVDADAEEEAFLAARHP